MIDPTAELVANHNSPNACPALPPADPALLDAVDWWVIGAYMVVILAVGCLAWRLRRRGSEGSGYFLAGRALAWPVIGLALFSTNISSIHLVSLAQAGYDSGLARGNFEWMAAFTLVILALCFAPFYIRSGVTTLPDFLEKRYARSLRDWLAVVSILSAVFIHLGFTLYTGAQVLKGFVSFPEPWLRLFDTQTWCIVLTAVATGVYTIVGGLLAVVLTESLQTVVLIAGAALLTWYGYTEVGGWHSLQATLAAKPEYAPYLTLLRPADDPSGLPWYSIVLGYPVIGIWYWCTDQTIVQRVLGAKSEIHARIGPLFAGFIKILPVFIFVLPGTLCLASILQRNIPALPLNKEGNPDTLQTYVHIIRHWLPLGLRGIVIAALLAALMSTVSGALNSIATLFSYDLVKRWRPEVSDHTLVRIGRAVTLAAMVAAILWSPWLEHYESVFDGINKMITYVAPPITALFVWGVLWRRISPAGALAAAWGGTVLGLACGVFEWCGGFQRLKTGWGIDIPFMMVAVYLFLACSAILVGVSLLRPAGPSPERDALVWKTPLEPLRGPWRGLGDFRLIAAVLVAVMIGLYWWFD